MALDAFAQLRLLGAGSRVPPATPSDGEVRWTGAGPSGDWTDRPERLARYAAGACIFLAPRQGWVAWR